MSETVPTDEPRLLAARPGRVRYIKRRGRWAIAETKSGAGQHQDYVTGSGAMLGEPEAVPAGWQQKMSDATRRREDEARSRERADGTARRDELVARVRRDLEELRRLPQENRAKRQRVDRALREMGGV